MGFGNVSGCHGAHSYEECQRHFNNERRPTARSGGELIWEDNERPLDDVRKHHYRVVQGEGEAYYDAVLYSTVMARYYRPEEGGRRVCYNYDSRQTSAQFMWRVTGHGKVIMRETTLGTRRIPVGPPSGYKYETFGADLWMTGPNASIVDISRSKHRPIEVPRASEEFKQWKRELRKELAPVFDLMKYSVADAPYVMRRGRARFLEHDVSKFQVERTGWRPGIPLTDAAARVLVEMYQERTESISDELKVPARIYAVETSVLNELSKMYTGKQHKYIPLPQFPEEVPTNFRFV